MPMSRRSQIALLAIVAALGASAAAAPGASAAVQRYASPTGAGNECSFEKPCNVVWAIQGATIGGTEVILKPGDYSVDYTIENQAPVTIHGVAGQPRPHLYLASGTQLRLKDVKLTYAEVLQYFPGGTPLAAWDSELNQVIVRGGPQTGCAAAIFDGVMRNSIVFAQNPDGNAICSQSFQGLNSSTYVNVTAIAQKGTAIEAYASGSTARVSLLVANVIARAGSGGVGLAARTTMDGATATIASLHTNLSNYVASGSNTIVAEGNDNQHMPPLFVDPAGGDYHQKAGSPTIDAGTPEDGVGTEDVDGDQRAVGAIDIGADEFVPSPTPGTGPATGDQPSTTTPDPTGTQTSPAGSFAGVKLASSRLALKRGFIVVKLSCPAGTSGRCTGVTKLTTRKRRTASRAARTVRLGRAGFSIAAGGQAKVKVRVSRAGRRLFAHTRRLRGRAANAAHDAAGLSKTTFARVSIRKR